MPLDKELADAFSDGLNCVAEIAECSHEFVTRRNAWIAALSSFLRALDSVSCASVVCAFDVPSSVRDHAERLLSALEGGDKMPPNASPIARRILEDMRVETGEGSR